MLSHLGNRPRGQSDDIPLRDGTSAERSEEEPCLWGNLPEHVKQTKFVHILYQLAWIGQTRTDHARQRMVEDLGEHDHIG